MTLKGKYAGTHASAHIIDTSQHPKTPALNPQQDCQQRLAIPKPRFAENRPNKVTQVQVLAVLAQELHSRSPAREFGIFGASKFQSLLEHLLAAIKQLKEIVDYEAWLSQPNRRRKARPLLDSHGQFG